MASAYAEHVLALNLHRWGQCAVYCATHPASGVADLAPLLRGVGKQVLSVDDSLATTAVDVPSWQRQKWTAILAHRREVVIERALPGLLARTDEGTRARILRTEYFTRLTPGPHRDGPYQLTACTNPTRPQLPAGSFRSEKHP